MAEAKLVIGADTSGAQAAIAALERKVESLQNAAKRVKAPKAPVAEPGAIDTAIAGLGRYVTATAAVAAAVKLVSAEWDNVIDRQRKAAQATLTFEEALGEAALNVGDVMAPERLKKRALEMSAKTGVSPSTAAQAISLAVKSGGATTPEEAERFATAAEAAGRLTPRASAQTLAASAGSIADYMARRNVTAEQASGVLLSMQSKSNIASSNKAMEAFGPVMANMAAQGASDAMIQAMGPALSQAISDKEGDMTATSVIAFTSALSEAGQSRFKGKANIPDLMLKFLQTNPEEARQFFTGEMLDLDTGKKLGKPEFGMGRTRTFFRSVAGDPDLPANEANASFRKQYEDAALRSIGPGQAAQYYEARLSQVRGATPTIQAERTLKGVADRARLRGGEGMTGAVRENLKEVLQATGQVDLLQKISSAEFDFSRTESREKAGELLERRAAAIERGGLSLEEEAGGRAALRSVPFIGPGMEALIDAIRPTPEVTEQDRETAKDLRDAAAELKKASENFAKVNRHGNVEPPSPVQVE